MSKKKSELGNYITNEYEILVKVLSYLPSKSLSSAAKVCREWRRVALRIRNKRNRPYGHFKKGKGDWSLDCFDEYIQPKIILNFGSSYGPRKEDMFPLISQIYDVTNLQFYKVRNIYFIGSGFTDSRLHVMWQLGIGKLDQAYVALCDMPGVSVQSCVVTAHKFSYNPSPAAVADTKERLRALMEPKPHSVILIGDMGNCQITQKVLEALGQFNHPISVAGGITQSRLWSFPEGKSQLTESCLCIAFSGENVSSHVGLHSLGQMHLQDFMKKLSQEAGPVPAGAYRIAFIFSCINRKEIYRETELEIFSDHFPNVPIYGLWSFGEVMFRYNSKRKLLSDAEVLDPKDPQHYFNAPLVHSECSSYLILTFKRED